MTEALIVAGARTPIGRAHKGSLVDVDAATLAEVGARRHDRPFRHRPGADRRHRARRVDAGRWRARPIRRQPARPHRGARPRQQPPLRGRVERGADRRREHPRRDGPDRARRGHREPQLDPQMLKSVPASARDPQPWAPESHPDRPEAPAWDMSITVGENAAREAGRHPRAVRRVGIPLASASRSPRSSPVGSTTRSCRSRSRTAPVALRLFARDEHPRGDTTLERLASLPAAAPRAPEPHGHGRQRRGAQRRGRGRAPDERCGGRRAGGDPARPDHLVGVGRHRPRADRSRADQGDPEGARSGRHEDRRHRTVRDQRGVLLDGGRIDADPRASTTRSSTSTGRGCGLGHPIAATGARMVVSMIHELRRRDQTVGCVAMCAGGGMGSALILELL